MHKHIATTTNIKSPRIEFLERALEIEYFAGLVKLIDEEINLADVWDEERHFIEVYHLLLNATRR